MKIVSYNSDGFVIVDVGNGNGFIADTFDQIRYEARDIQSLYKNGWQDGQPDNAPSVNTIMSYREV